MNRILVIRGGAIGDFILTLPAIKALREAHPMARIEILGYKHIAALAENRFYADAVRSIEYGPLSGFFAKNDDLNKELRDYFGSFDLVLTYLYDPDTIFETNLRRCGVKRIVRGPAKINTGSHATIQLARPLGEFGLRCETLDPRIYLSEEDRQFAAEFLRDLPEPVIAIHPGSGGETKNWPLENWLSFAKGLSNDASLVIVSGEADDLQLRKFELEWQTNARVRFARNLPLPQLGAIFEKTVFVGHDSGISHLAAATGARCVLLFGPTDPDVWAPLNENVQIIRADSRQIGAIEVAAVEVAVLAQIDKMEILRQLPPA